MNDMHQLFYIDKSWSELNRIIEENAYAQIFVLVDSNTHEFCLPLIISELSQAFDIIEIEAGEASKDLDICAYIWQDLTSKAADRKALMINLGGGVVTDLGGFIASVYKRGIDFINIPTSLLAMVDASSGGKCGIDFMGFKNQLGSFKEPIACFIYSDFLKTLPALELKSGFAEMLKHGLIADKKYLSSLKELKRVQLSDIQKSVEIKKRIVQLDPFEEGERRKLNFGHTIGHALESYFYSQNNPIPHGHAVAAGLLCESYISHQMNGMTLIDLNEIISLIHRNYKKLSFTETDIFKVVEYMAQDKKNEGGSNRFTLLTEIGEASINHEVENKLIVEALVFYLEGYEI